jgi:hypothetical protein
LSTRQTAAQAGVPFCETYMIRRTRTAAKPGAPRGRAKGAWKARLTADGRRPEALWREPMAARCQPRQAALHSWVRGSMIPGSAATATGIPRHSRKREDPQTLITEDP